MDEKRLEELEKLAREATPGPWVPKHVKTVYLDTGEQEHWVKSRANGMVVAVIKFHPVEGEHQQEDSDIEFIAAAREAVPALVAEVRRLQVEASEHALNSDTWRRLAQEREAEVRRLRRVEAALAQNLRDAIVEASPTEAEAKRIVEEVIQEASAEAP